MMQRMSYSLCVAAGLLLIGAWLWEGEWSADSVLWPAMGMYFIGKGLFIRTIYGYLPLPQGGKEP